MCVLFSFSFLLFVHKIHLSLKIINISLTDLKYYFFCEKKNLYILLNRNIKKYFNLFLDVIIIWIFFRKISAEQLRIKCVDYNNTIDSIRFMIFFIVDVCDVYRASHKTFALTRWNVKKKTKNISIYFSLKKTKSFTIYIYLIDQCDTLYTAFNPAMSHNALC